MDLAEKLGWRLIERRDVFAAQQADGTYKPVREPIKKSTVVAHVAGERTVGHYLVSHEDKCRVFVLDIDLIAQKRDATGELTQTGVWTDEQGERHDIDPRVAWLDPRHPAKPDLTMQLRCVAEGFALRIKRVLDIPVAIAYTGCKGLHVYGFTGSADAADAMVLADQMLDELGWEPSRGTCFFSNREAHPNLEIERFPKQASLEGKDLGNLVRLPLGINRKTGQSGFFIDPRCPYTELREADPLVALDGDPWQGERWSDPA